MALRFCLKTGKESFPKVFLSESVFTDIKGVYKKNPEVEYVDIYKGEQYVCSSFNDPNADLILRHILILKTSNNFLNYFSHKKICIYSCNEISYAFYQLCVLAGASVKLVGPIWPDIGAYSINATFITPDYELYAEGNPGFDIVNFWHWSNSFPIKQYEFIEELFHHFNKNELLYNSTVIKDYSIKNWLGNRIQNNEPTMIARLGNTEAIITTESSEGMVSRYWQGWLTRTSGFFSNNPDIDCDKYAELTISAIKECDMHLCHFESGISLLNSYASQTSIFVPWYSLFLEKKDQAWLSLLRCKRVLIISSINQLIQKQIQIYPDLLFGCELLYYNCPETYFPQQRHYDNWFKELDAIKHDLSRYDYEIAIVAAGSYGYPLSLYIKETGKIAIELCSGLYPLCKIKNKTQAIIPAISKQYDNTWLSPKECEISNMDIEKGAYWY